MTTNGLPQASEKQNIPPQSTFGNNENAERIFTNFLPHMKLGGPALPQGPKSSFNNEEASRSSFSIDFSNERWGRKCQNSLIHENLDEGIPPNPYLRDSSCCQMCPKGKMFVFFVEKVKGLKKQRIRGSNQFFVQDNVLI